MTSRKRPENQNIASAEKLRDLLPIEQSLLSAVARKIKIRQDGTEREIAVGDAIIQKQAQSALAGSTHAQGQILRGIYRAERAAKRKADAEVAHGRELLAFFQIKLRRWIEAGNDPKVAGRGASDAIEIICRQPVRLGQDFETLLGKSPSPHARTRVRIHADSGRFVIKQYHLIHNRQR